jgi:hypothetical protein
VFSPWDVDVTTERPSKERLERTDLDDQEFGKEVCITNMPPVSVSCSQPLLQPVNTYIYECSK